MATVSITINFTSDQTDPTLPSWMYANPNDVIARIQQLVREEARKTAQLRQLLQQEQLLQPHGALDQKLKQWWHGLSNDIQQHYVIRAGVWSYHP